MTGIDAILQWLPYRQNRRRDQMESRIMEELRGLAQDAKELREAADRCAKCWCFKHYRATIQKNGNA